MFAGCHWRMPLVGVLIATLSGCATSGRPKTYPNEFSEQPALKELAPVGAEIGPPNGGISGVWEGASIAHCIGIGLANPGRCGAVEHITLTMFQRGSNVTGSYKCSFGTEDCRNQEESGVIKNGSLSKGRLMMRVMLEDGAMCYFTGVPDKNRFDGGYSCIGATVIEQGHFATRRNY